MRTKIFILLTAILTVCVMFLSKMDWNLSHNEKKERFNFPPNQQQIHMQAMQKEIYVMSLKISAMEKNLSSQTEKTINTVMRSFQEKLSTQLTELENENLQTIEFEPLNKSEEDEQAIENTMVTHLDDQLYSGKKDEAWERHLEDDIHHSLEKIPANSTTLLDIHCDTSLCKVEVEQENTDDQMLFMTNLSQLEAFNDKETFYKTNIDDKGNKITLLYVARDGYRLPEAPYQ